MLEGQNEIYVAVITSSVIFLMIAMGLILLVIIYNRRKKKHIEEKALMQLTFEAEIAKAQFEIREQTMQTIGADLHDNIGQLLSLTSLTLSSIELDNEARARQKIDDSVSLTLRSIREMRLLGKLLQGDQLVALGLTEAIRYEISYMERSGHYTIVYTVGDEIPAINNPDKDLIIFRILQEIFNNIMKHAAATEIVVKLDHEGGTLKLCVNDNGVGFAAEEVPLAKHGMGLQNIQKRAAIIGGEAIVTSHPGGGTHITIFIPYP